MYHFIIIEMLIEVLLLSFHHWRSRSTDRPTVLDRQTNLIIILLQILIIIVRLLLSNRCFQFLFAQRHGADYPPKLGPRHAVLEPLDDGGIRPQILRIAHQFERIQQRRNHYDVGQRQLPSHQVGLLVVVVVGFFLLLQVRLERREGRPEISFGFFVTVACVRVAFVCLLFR